MKKVLAWAVVLALVLSSFTMAFAADAAKTSKDFKDASQINYTEAVDVMVATGIINGFPDGTFGPQKTVTRGQMAKMIACIKNGGEDVGDQFKSACPFADSKDHWAAGYIAYCASEHIIDGRSADKFDPDAEVTGTEVAKMALTSLGYDSKIQGYTGENWAAAVLKDAKKNNLFKDLDSSFVPGDPCDRESAAQILFNMLKATEVEYNQKMSVSTGETSVEVSGKATEVENKTASDNGDQKMQMYEDVFGGKLVLTPKVNADGTPKETVTDEFGNPGHTWTYDKAKVGTYTDATAYEFVVEKVEGENNTAKVTAAFQNYDKDAAEKAVIASVDVNNGVTDAAVSLGDKVKLYETTVADAEEGKSYYNAVVTQYKPYQITKVDTNTKKFSKDEIEKGITAKLELTGANGKKVNADNTMVGYDANTYVKDAIIAVALTKDGNKDAVLDSYVPEELVKGKVTKTKGVNVTIEGTEYEPSAAPLTLYGETAAAGNTAVLTVGHEYTVYDYNGYMFAAKFVEAPAPEEFYGLVTATKKAKDQTADPNAWTDADQTKEADMVKVLTPEEKTETLAFAEDVVINPSTVKLPAVGSLVKYELNEDGDISKITIALETSALGTGQPVKTGDVLYGKQLSEDVVAYANIKDTTDPSAKDEWKVYSLDDLKAATAVDVLFSFDEEAGVVAMKIESLEEKAKANEVFAFLTTKTGIQNDTGNAFELEVFEKGSAKTYTTVGSNGKTEGQYSAISNWFEQNPVDKAALVKLTLDGDLVKAIEFANCKGENAPVKEFPVLTPASGSADAVKYDAVFFGDGTTAAEWYYKVNGIPEKGNYLNVGTKATINNQSVTEDAVVYYLNKEGKVEASEFGSIEEGNFVILMQLNEGSSTWDTVIFTDQNLPSPKNPDNAPA